MIAESDEAADKKTAEEITKFDDIGEAMEVEGGQLLSSNKDFPVRNSEDDDDDEDKSNAGLSVPGTLACWGAERVQIPPIR